MRNLFKKGLNISSTQFKIVGLLFFLIIRYITHTFYKTYYNFYNIQFRVYQYCLMNFRNFIQKIKEIDINRQFFKKIIFMYKKVQSQ